MNGSSEEKSYRRRQSTSGQRTVSRAALAEMFRQTGDRLVSDENGLLRRGLVVRLLVLPNDLGGVRDSLAWIRDQLSPHVAISLMAQYYPTNAAGTNQRYALLFRDYLRTHPNSAKTVEWIKRQRSLD